jgi:hypothetical protein
MLSPPPYLRAAWMSWLLASTPITADACGAAKRQKTPCPQHRSSSFSRPDNSSIRKAAGRMTWRW